MGRWPRGQINIPRERRAFPLVEHGAHCLLCQQSLDHATGHRLQQFETFVASTTERELRHLRDTYARLRTSFVELKTTTDAIEETLKELRIGHMILADAISAAIATNEMRRTGRSRSTDATRSLP
jgi:hypothetical protein